MANFAGLKRAIIDYMTANLPKDRNNAVMGKILGNKVIVQGKTYYADKVSDMVYEDGDLVYCLLPDLGQNAAVVGKV